MAKMLILDPKKIMGEYGEILKVKIIVGKKKSTYAIDEPSNLV